MKVTYIGNFRPAHSTENHLAATLTDLGATVVVVQQDEADAHWPRVTNEALSSDLVLYTRTHSWGDLPRGDRLWEACAEAGVRTASVHLDLFIGITREEDVVRRDPLFTTGTVFTPDGDHDEEWRGYGVNHEYLRAGVLRDEARPGVRSPHYEGFDVAFVGSSFRYHQEWQYRQRLLAFLEAEYGDRFLLVPRRGEPAVRGQALNDLYATVPVIVGDSLCLNRERATYWSDRPYETVGRGGFLVMPHVDALAEEFYYADALVTYPWDDFPALRRTVDRHVEMFRDAPEMRDAMTGASSAWVRDHASYTNRVIQMLDTLGLPYSVPASLAS